MLPSSCANLIMTTTTDIATDLSSVSWDPVTNATGYRLTISGTLNNNLPETEVTATTHNFANEFEEGETVSVTIIPFNADGDAVGCTTPQTFTIIEDMNPVTTIPDCTTLTTPSDIRDVSTTTNFEWDAVANADGYRISIGTTSGGIDVLNDEDVGFLTSFNLDRNLFEGTTYYITITPYNNTSGAAENCTEYVFTTIESPINDVKYGFSPDGDGINDFWEIDGIENHPDNIVTIFNRWGDMVFQIQGYNNTSNVFNGTANQKTKTGAKILPEGTYFFNFTINEPHNFNSLQGFVVIKR